ncbi:hypothetical protein [Ekhidna sp.]|uniref:hypothetical protein n=1 Tax=Ekhidna sp. TaxID=2608089 RepID=UPI003B5A6206
MTKKVLLISPYFPPHRAIGTKRAINFVQGVHGKENWEVIVLTSKPLNDNNDPSLLHQVPEGVITNYSFVGALRPIIQFFSGSKKKTSKVTLAKPVSNPKVAKKKSSQKGSLTPFDQYLWDVGAGVRNGKKLIEKYRPDAIWVNADPWSGFLVADKLSRKYNIPWVADLRDPWTVFEKKMDLRPKLTAKIIRWYERKFFTSATKVVLNTETACQAYTNAYPESLQGKFTFIRNAFNENLLIGDQAENSTQKPFIFGYYGGFRKFVPSQYLLKGFSEFVKQNGLSPDQVRIDVRGNVYSDFWDQVTEYQVHNYVTVEREVNLNETVSLLRSWDVLLLSAIHDFRWMISAKFYDYIYARKPILAVSDNEELNQLIETTKSGKWANTDEPNKISRMFEGFYNAGKTDLLSNEELIKSFGFEHQASLFRKELNEITPAEKA